MVNGLVELTDECIKKIDRECDKYCNPKLAIECPEYQRAVTTQKPIRQGSRALYYLIPYVQRK